MTTSRKKKEFNKNLKKENNKTSKRKIRKRSKNKISKKRLLARNKLGGAQYLSNPKEIIDILSQRNKSETREPNDIYSVLIDHGGKFVNEYNEKIKETNLPRIKIGEKKTRVSPRDESVYLTIQDSQTNQEIFHISDHPGESISGCGAVHIKQLKHFNGEGLSGNNRCFRIIKNSHNLNSISLDPINHYDKIDYTSNLEFQILKSFIESIGENNVIDLGLYTRITPELIQSLQSEYSSPTKSTTYDNPYDSMKTETSNTPQHQRHSSLVGFNDGRRLDF